jgi:two-component system phosphate regulon sensor histidine kinase PhoR
VKKEVIRGLIGIIALCMIGLVASQLYWISNAVEQRTARFNHEIRKVMFNAATSIERNEMIEKLENGKILKKKIQEDLLATSYFDFKKDTTIEINGGTMTVRVQQQKNANIGVDLGYANIGFDGRHQENELNEVVHQRKRVIKDSLIFTQDEINNRVKRRMQHVDELMTGLLDFNINKNIQERIDIPTVDSIITSELIARGIDVNYKLGVFSAYNQPIMLNKDDTKEDYKNLIHSRYRVRLFPNDILQESNLLKLYFPNQRSYVLQTMWFMLSTSAILILVILGVFWYTIQTILKQKKVSEIKNDFINNMTHELKTPIATIGLACEALTDKDLTRTDSMVDSFVGMINDENKRLGTLVENVLKSAVFDKGELALKKEQIDLFQLVDEVVQSMNIQAKSKGGLIKIDPMLNNVFLQADPMHITNVMYNLLDNAIKYSQNAPTVVVNITENNNNVIVSVKDQGVGISQDNQKRIFDKLYRVPTGNVHNVKGFGLGLSYVKAIVEKHDGSIAVRSTLGQGTNITIIIPIENEKKS